MNGLNMSQADLEEVIGQVQATLDGIAKNEATVAAALAKSDGESSGSEESPPGSASAGTPPPPPTDAPPVDPSAAPASPAGDPGAPPVDPSAAPPVNPGAPPADAGATGPSFEELVTLYTQLPPEDFEAHAAALQQAAQSRSGGASPAGPSAGGPPPSPAPSPGPSPAPTLKNEQALKDSIGALQKSLEEQKQVIEALGAVVTAPRRKAVTGVTFIPFSKSEDEKGNSKPFEQLTKNELMEALKVKTADPKLGKTERNLITGYCLGTVRRDALADIFKEPSKK